MRAWAHASGWDSLLGHPQDWPAEDGTGSRVPKAPMMVLTRTPSPDIGFRKMRQRTQTGAQNGDQRLVADGTSSGLITA